MEEEQSPSWAVRLRQRIDDRTARVCVMGLGYVGLPLAVLLAETGFRVTGIEPDESKCAAINRGESYIGDVSAASIAALSETGRLRASPEPSPLGDADAVIICVPTPLSKSKDPDISYIVGAVDDLARYRHPGLLVILESTTYPGTTEEILLPRIQSNGYVVGQDVFVAFSPERVDPGNKTYTIRNTPKVVGGVTSACLSLAQALYDAVVERTVPVSSPATAEMVKILENTYRAVNIGLVNEMAQICQRIGLDVWEVIAAASTKPFGYSPFYPGPGLGGHCIPIDPLYLTWKMRSLSVQTRFIELADVVNADMPRYVVRRVQDALNDAEQPLRNSLVLVLGVAYKPNVADLRESPALTIIELLQERGAVVRYHDPYVSHLALASGETLEGLAVLTEEDLALADCVLVHTAHSSYDWSSIARTARLIFDTRGVIRKDQVSDSALLYRL
ncbi:MAG: nucleotide sugar dehydrogenase [Anaerolineae bacterium]